MRPGFGHRHAGLLKLLASHAPAAVEQVTWLDGTLPLEVVAYPVTASPPDELVTSVRCIVSVGDCLIACRTPDGVHVWPGGHRKTRETAKQTACREVHEETGWRLDDQDLQPLGFVHYRHLTPQPADYPYPHPDFINTVYAAVATSRDVPEDAEWTDLDGWERHSALIAQEGLAELPLSAVQQAFIDYRDSALL